MSFRNRPVLDRKHRPRWQDELRTQQLIVAGFALAIAVAVGIFAAAAWNGFYQSNLRQAALVDGTPVQRGDVVKRIQIVAAELQATAVRTVNQTKSFFTSPESGAPTTLSPRRDHFVVASLPSGDLAGSGWANTRETDRQDSPVAAI